MFDANQIQLINPINLTLNIKIYISCGAECTPSISEIRLTGLQIFHRMILYMKHNILHEIWIGLNLEIIFIFKGGVNITTNFSKDIQKALKVCLKKALS